MRRFILFFAMIAFVVSTQAQNRRDSIKDPITICNGATFTHTPSGGSNTFSQSFSSDVTNGEFFYGTAGDEDTLVIVSLTVVAEFKNQSDVYEDATCQSDQLYTTSVYISSKFTDIDVSIPGEFTIDDTLQSVLGGCDSIIRLILTVHPNYANQSDVYEDATCQSDQLYTTSVYISSKFTDIDVSIPGEFTIDDTLQSVLGGCDSIIQLKLTVHPIYSYESDIVYDTTCQSDEPYTVTKYTAVNFTGIDVSTTGEFTIDSALKTVNGCDSIIQLKLTVHPVYVEILYDTTCQDTAKYKSLKHTSQKFAKIDVSTAGELTIDDTLRTFNDCDSIIRLKLTVNPIYSIIHYDTVCIGDSIPNSLDVNFEALKDTTIKFSFKTELGCDSIVSYQYTILDIAKAEILGHEDAICEGSSITLTVELNGADSIRWYSGGDTLSLTLDKLTHDSIVSLIAYQTISNKTCQREITETVLVTVPTESLGAIQGIVVIPQSGDYKYSVEDIEHATYQWSVSNNKWFVVENGYFATISMEKGDTGTVSVTVTNVCGKDASRSLKIRTNTTSIVDTENELQTRIYPNPASDKVSIDNGNIIIKEIHVYDIIGKKVKQIPVNKTKIDVDMKDLIPGIYMFTIETEKTSETRKVIKQ